MNVAERINDGASTPAAGAVEIMQCGEERDRERERAGSGGSVKRLGRANGGGANGASGGAGDDARGSVGDAGGGDAHNHWAHSPLIYHLKPANGTKNYDTNSDLAEITMIGRCEDSLEVWHEGSLGRKRSCKRDRRPARADEDADAREPLHEANHQPHPPHPPHPPHQPHQQHQSLQSQQSNQPRSRPEMSPLRARGAHDFAPFPKRVSPSRSVTASGVGVAPAPCERERDREPERERRRERMQRHRRPPRRRVRHAAKENDPGVYRDRDHRDDRIDRIDDDERDFDSYATEITDEPMRTNLFSELRQRELEDAGDDRLQPAADLFHRRGDRDRDRSPSPLPKPLSPGRAPFVDLSTLHEQLGPSEPIRSVPTKLIGFPWRPDTEEIMEPLIKSRHMSSKNHHVESYTLPESAMSNMAVVFNKCTNKRDLQRPDEDSKDCDFFDDSVQDDRLQKINKKIQTLKRKLLKYESEFEQMNGYRISQADKMNHPILSKLYSELHYLKLDKKRIQTNGTDSIISEKRKPVREIWDDCDISFSSNKPMAELVSDIEKWVDKRASNIGSGESSIAAEKAALQVALLRLEAARGRPRRAGPERPAARPLYDRYRALKRMLKADDRTENAPISGIVGELETILEHEALLFTNASIDSSSDSQEKQSDDNEDKDDDKEYTKLTPSRTESEEASSSAKSTASEEMQPSESQASAYTNESLHCLPYDELTRLLSDARALKTNLRTAIKTSEIDFEIKNGRKFQKDERAELEQDYVRYKEVKARIRLLTALVNKHKKMVVDR